MPHVRVLRTDVRSTLKAFNVLGLSFPALYPSYDE
jgi:hypothetical protein